MTVLELITACDNIYNSNDLIVIYRGTEQEKIIDMSLSEYLNDNVLRHEKVERFCVKKFGYGSILTITVI